MRFVSVLPPKGSCRRGAIPSLGTWELPGIPALPVRMPERMLRVWSPSFGAGASFLREVGLWTIGSSFLPAFLGGAEPRGANMERQGSREVERLDRRHTGVQLAPSKRGGLRGTPHHGVRCPELRSAHAEWPFALVTYTERDVMLARLARAFLALPYESPLRSPPAPTVLEYALAQ